MRVPCLIVLMSLAACQPNSSGGQSAAIPGEAGNSAWSLVGPREVLHFTGTEPFWAGQVVATSLTWQTPDNQGGTRIAVERFAGRNGLGLSGMLDGRPFDLAVSAAPCSDGMSDRRYPFTVTVKRGSETLRGCGWGDKHPFSGASQP